MYKEIKFCCPDCEGSVIEEIQSDVTIYTEINVLYDDETIVYGEATNEDGKLEQYQCRDCGYVIVDHNMCDGLLDTQSLIEAIRKLGEYSETTEAQEE